MGGLEAPPVCRARPKTLALRQGTRYNAYGSGAWASGEGSASLQGIDFVSQQLDDTVIRSRARIVGEHILHAGSRLLSRVLPIRATQDLEFEHRYRRCVAEYGEADSDIYISTYSKSGTTWVQIILYQLTTPGDMDFDHLFDISPWLWYAALRQVPPANPPPPRLLKSHDDYRRFRRGRRGRFLFVVRDGRDVAVSLYHHRRNFKRYEGTFDEFFEEFLHDTEYNWFDHLRPWLENAYGLDMHYVKFEDLKSDFEATVQAIADFCAIDVDAATMERTCQRCTFDAMKKHELQLGPRDSHFEGMPDAPFMVKHPDQFLRKGKVGEGLTVLSEAQLAAYRERFDRSLADFPLVADYR